MPVDDLDDARNALSSVARQLTLAAAVPPTPAEERALETAFHTLGLPARMAKVLNALETTARQLKLSSRGGNSMQDREALQAAVAVLEQAGRDAGFLLRKP